MKKQKHPKDSQVTMTEVVFPNDTNPMGIIQGGRIIQLMDIACAICAQTHSERIAVTASIDKVSFMHPARLGDILMIRATITRSFTTSMEIFAEVRSKRLPDLKSKITSEAYFTFVALDENALPVQVIPVVPVTAAEKVQFRQALLRKKNLNK